MRGPPLAGWRPTKVEPLGAGLESRGIHTCRAPILTIEVWAYALSSLGFLIERLAPRWWKGPLRTLSFTFSLFFLAFAIRRRGPYDHLRLLFLALRWPIRSGRTVVVTTSVVSRQRHEEKGHPAVFHEVRQQGVQRFGTTGQRPDAPSGPLGSQSEELHISTVELAPSNARVARWRDTVLLLNHLRHPLSVDSERDD